MNILLVFFILAAYLLGSIPFGLIAGLKVKGIDLRQHGSRNIGATNVFRVVGKRWGILVLLLDAIKGYLACLLPFLFGQPLGLPLQLLLGICAILGHSFPVWLGFKAERVWQLHWGYFWPLPGSQH